MSLPLLKLIGHEIAKASWDPNSKQVIWTACVVAFCGSFRLGEILAKNEWSFNTTETLLWSDVKFTKLNQCSFMYRLRNLAMQKVPILTPSS